MNNVADGILSGPGSSNTLCPNPRSLRQPKAAICNPLEARAAAIIRLRLFEVATDASDTRLADRRLKSLRSSVNGALGCAPTDGLLSFITYWSAINQGDAVSDHLEELRRSYGTHPA
jgi:hypothetical protein